MIKRLLLPLGLVVALIAALFAPGTGIWLASPRTAFAMIATMFLINGYQTDFKMFRINGRLTGAFLIAALVSFLGGSLLSKSLVSLLAFDPQIATGILVMSTMAPTLSSVIVITKESGGNTHWAILMTVGLNLLAIFATPVQLKFLLSGTTVSIPVAPLLLDLTLSVLVPFVIGTILRRIIKLPPSGLINLLPTLLVILLSYMSFCSGRHTLVESTLSTLVLILATLLALHLALFFIAIGLTRLFGYHSPERKAVAFLSSQKTLPTAIGILASMGYAGSAAALPCVMFHFTQILSDSIIATIWRSRKALPKPCPADEPVEASV